MSERLAGLKDAEKLVMVTGLILRHAAAVLGYADDARLPLTFENSGLDSLSAMELRNMLNASTGLRLSPTIIFDYNTPDALARYIVNEMDGPATSTDTILQSDEATSDNSARILVQDSVEALFKDAVDTGRTSDGVQLLRAASRLRSTFGPKCDLGLLPSPMTFTRGRELPHLVFVCTSTITSGVHAYARIASQFRDERPVSAIRLCGFSAGEPLPSSHGAAVETLARQVIDLVGDEPFVVGGYSSGGNFAYALGHYFEKVRNENLVGVALLDTFPATNMENMEREFSNEFSTRYSKELTPWDSTIPQD